MTTCTNPCEMCNVEARQASVEAIMASKKGPAYVTLPDFRALDLWYNRDIRLWTLQLKDREGNQIGPGHDGEALYAHNRTELIEEMLMIVYADAPTPKAVEY